MAIKRAVFLEAGGFHEELYPNEENELINRISRMGYKFIYSPDIRIYRDRRSISSSLQAVFCYGQGRFNQIKIEGLLGNLQFLIPLLFLFYFISLFFADNTRLILSRLLYISS